MRPIRVAGFGDGDEIRAIEDSGDAIDIEELGGQRRRVRGCEGRAWREVFYE